MGWGMSLSAFSPVKPGKISICPRRDPGVNSDRSLSLPYLPQEATVPSAWAPE